MRSLALILPALLAMASVVPRAEAQLLPAGQTTATGGLGTATGTGATTTVPQGNAFFGSWEAARILYGDGRIEKIDPDEPFISTVECKQRFEFEFQNVTPRAAVMQVWVSNDPATDCSNPSARIVSTANPQPLCWLIAERTNVRGTGQKFEVSGSQIFNLKRTAVVERDETNAEAICTEQQASGTAYTVWFLPLGTQTVGNTGTAPAITAPASRIRLNLYTLSPPDPSGVEVRGGESAITADWNNDADPLMNYRAFFNVGPDNAVCGTGALRGGMPGNEVVVDGTTVFRSGKLNKPSAALKDLDAKGILFGTQVAVAVASEDLAGNIGNLSQPQCVTRVETVSAIDACGGVEDCGLETCGLSPASRGSWFCLSLFVLGLAALIRRRTA